MKSPAVEPSGEHYFVDAGGEILLPVCLLGQIANLILLQPVSESYPSFFYIFKPEKALYKCTLAGAVLSDKAQIIAIFYFKIQKN